MAVRGLWEHFIYTINTTTALALKWLKSQWSIMGQWDHSMCWYYHAPCQETHICYHANTHMSGLNTFSSAVLKLHIKGAAQRRSGPVRPSDCDDGSSFTVLSHVLAAVGHLWNTSGARRGLKKYYYDHTVCKDGCFSKMISLMSGHKCFFCTRGIDVCPKWIVCWNVLNWSSNCFVREISRVVLNDLVFVTEFKTSKNE